MKHRSGRHRPHPTGSAIQLGKSFKSLMLAVALLAFFSMPLSASAQTEPVQAAVESAASVDKSTSPKPSADSPLGSKTAADKSDGSASPLKAQSEESHFVQTGLGLAFVIALLFGLLWVMKRAGLNPAQSGSHFYKVLAVTSLGPREKIALIEVGDQWLMVGMTQHSINTLHTMPKGSLDFNPERNASAAFAKLLDRMKKPEVKSTPKP